MSARVRKLIGRKRILLAMAVSVSILAVLVWKMQIRFDEMAQQFVQMDWRMVGAACVFSALWHMFVGADKWWRILRAQKAIVGYWEVFRVRMGSDPIRVAMPFKAGEIVNAAYFGKLESSSFSRAAGSIAFDKALNVFGTVFWLYVGVMSMSSIPAERSFVLHSVVGAGLLALICFRPLRQAAMGLAGAVHPKLGRFAGGVLSAFEEFSPAKKIGFLAYGIVFQLRPLVVCYLLFAATLSPGDRPPIQEIIAYGAVVVLMSNVPLGAVGAIGQREATLAALFHNYGGGEMLLLIGLMMSFAMQILPAILGIPLMFPLLRALAPDADEIATQDIAPPTLDEERVAVLDPGYRGDDPL